MIEHLRIPLSEIPDEGYRVDTIVLGDALRPEGARELPLGHITISGSLTLINGVGQFHGAVTGAYHGVCDWCGESVESPFLVRVVWTYYESLPGYEPAESSSEFIREDGIVSSSHAYTEDCIDLGPAAWEEIVLSAPMKLDDELCACQKPDLTAQPYSSGAPAEPARPNKFAQLAEIFHEWKPKED